MTGRLLRLGLAEVFAGTDLAPATSPLSLIFFSKRMRSARSRPVAERFMVAYLRALREVSRMSPRELMAVAGKDRGGPASEEEFTTLYIDPDESVGEGCFQELQEEAHRRGLIQGTYRAADLVDNSYVEHARRVLAERAAQPR